MSTTGETGIRLLEIWYRDNKLGSNYISRRKFMSEGNLRRPFSEGEAKLRQDGMFFL